MKRKISVIISAVFLIGIALLWLGNRQNSPAVSAQMRDLTTLHAADTSANRSETMARQHVSSPGRSVDSLSILDGSDRYALEMHNTLPGRETSKLANFIRTSNLEMFYAKPWIATNVSRSSNLETFYAGPWYNGD
jgi:hypothetical protein